jgi:hypothetical protein
MNTDWLILDIWNRSHSDINERLRAAATGPGQVGLARAVPGMSRFTPAECLSTASY